MGCKDCDFRHILVQKNMIFYDLWEARKISMCRKFFSELLRFQLAGVLHEIIEIFAFPLCIEKQAMLNIH